MSVPSLHLGRRGAASAASLRWLILALPALVITAVFVVYPVIDSMRLSLTSWPGYGPKQDVGFSNFRRFFDDPYARGAIWHSMLFAAVTAGFTTGVGAAIAVALDRRIRGHKLFKFVIFLPVVLPSTFIALAWSNGFDPYFGWASKLLETVGLSHAWLADPDTVIYAVAAAAILQGTGFPMIVILSALGDIPKEIHEAATLDGVSAVQRARLVTLPLVRDVFATMLLLQLIFNYASFDFVFIMTNGGPDGASDLVGTFVYHQAFVQSQFGYAAAAALVTSVLMAILSMVYMTVFRTRSISRAG